MVSLPTVGNAIVTTTAPQSSVTAGVIEQGANLMASALGKVADASMDIATDMAKKQAANDLMAQKVTRDADGNVDVVNPVSAPLLFGTAAEKYNDLVQTGTIAQHANSLSEDFAALHQKYPADPVGFQTAANAHLQRTAATVTGPIGEAVQREGRQLLTQHFNDITQKAASIDVAKNAGDIAAAQSSARDDTMAMAFGGMSSDNPALMARQAAFEHAVAMRAANPLFGYSKEQAALDVVKFHSGIAANMLRHDVDAVYKDQSSHEETLPDGTKVQVANGGYAKAIEKAHDVLTNEAYKMPMADREGYFHQMTGDIHANEALRHQDIAEAQAAFSDLTMQSAIGFPISSDQVESSAKAFRAAGAPARAAAVYQAFAHKPLNDAFGNQSIPTMNQQIVGLLGLATVRDDAQYFQSKGYGGPGAAAMASHLAHESGGDPAAIGDNGTSGGIAQFHNERLVALKDFAAARGKPWTDRATQLDFVDHEMHTTEAATFAKLQASKTPEEASAAAYDFERPAGWKPGDLSGVKDVQSRANLARAIYEGKLPDQSMGPAGSAWLAANHQRVLSDAATTQWQKAVKDFNTDGAVPSIQTVNDITQSARLTNNGDLLGNIARDGARMDRVRNEGLRALSDQNADITEMQTAAQTGMSNPGDADLVKGYMRRRDAIVSGLDKNPMATTVINWSKNLKIEDVPPLDFTSDDSLAASLKARGSIAQFGAAAWKPPGPLSVLDEPEVKQVQGILAGPDIGAKLRVFNAMGALPEGVRGATLAKLAKNDVVSGTEVFAGAMLPQDQDVAAGILTGLKAQDTDTRYVPSVDTPKKLYQTAKDAALPIAAFNVAARTNPNGSYAVMSSAVDALYAARSAQAGDVTGTLDSNRLKKAVNDVTGGILDHNGAPIIAPARGMQQSQFDGVMAGITGADMAGVTTGKGAPITADYLRNSAKLHSFGDGRYLVQVNLEDKNPLYAKGPGGGPFILDLRNRPQVPVVPAYVAPPEMDVR
jgi:hypothetical protein